MNTTSIANRGPATNGGALPTENVPRRTRIEVRVTTFKEFSKNTLRGFLDVELPAIGLSIVGCSLHEKVDSRWIGFPGRPYQENGAIKYATILDIADKDARAAFQQAALAAVDEFLAAERRRS